MAHAPFSGDFESLARQYWSTWNELLGRSGGSDPWSLMGSMPPGLGRVDPGSFDWYGRMQRLAADFSGGGNAGDIARAWRDMLGGQGADPFAGMLRSMHGGLAGGDWIEQIRPMLDMLLRPLRQQGSDWLQRPAFGPAREHQERLQSLALAWQEWEQRNEAFTALLGQAGQGAFERFEQLLREHDAPGKRLESARALFDLWIDAAEQAWAEIAISVEYRHAYAEMTNALMRLRLGLQREVEQFGTMLGLPGRGEVDALHRKVADLERSLHAARRAAAAPRAAVAARAQSAAPAASTVQDDEAASGAGKHARKPRRKVAVPSHPSPKRVPASRSAPKQPARKTRRAPPTATRAVAGTATPRAAETANTGSVAAAPAKRVARKAAAPGKAARKTAPKTAPKAARKTPAAAVRSTGKAKPAAKAAAARPAAAPRVPAKPVAPARASEKMPAAAGPRQRQAKAAPARGKAAAAAAKSAGRPGRKPKQAAANSGPRRTPGAAASTTTALPSNAPATAKVVSMKDWVSRNLAATSNEDAAPSGRKAGGKRGGRNR